MVKFKALKKIAALTAAIAMVLSFAVCAGAVSVKTSTQYVAGTNNTQINVIANVSGLGDAEYVTYYAKNDAGVVYVDQKPVDNGAATFDYETAATNIDSNVKVGYTAGTSAEEATTYGYKVTVAGGTAAPVVIPTVFNDNITLEYPVGADNEVVGVSATNADAKLVIHDDASVTVALSNVKGDVVVTVETKALPNAGAEAFHVASAAIVSTGKDTDATYEYDVENGQGEQITGSAREEYEAAENNRKLTVLARVEKSNEFGVIITTDKIEVGAVTELPEGCTYAAQAAGTDGHFAVQLIDVGENVEGALIQAGVDYNTYIYYATTKGYTIIAGGVANTTPAVTE